MSKTLRDQITASAGKVGEIVPVTVEGIDETLYVRRLSIEERAGIADTGIKPGRRANVATGLNLVAASVVNPDRTPFASRDEWAAYANDHYEVFERLARAASDVQGQASKEDTEALGKG